MNVPTSSPVVPGALVLVIAFVSSTSMPASEASSPLSAPLDIAPVTPAARTKLSGYLGDRHAANLVYLQYLHDAVPPWREIGKGQAPSDERVGRDWMLDAFRRRGQPRARDWQGEYAGKWIDAAAWTVGNTGDARLSADVDAMVQGLIASQTFDGYLGIDVPEDRGRAWDVWNIWYALTGLLSDYEACGHRESLEAARRGGEYLVDNYLPPEARYHIFHGAWQGGCTVDVLDQVVRLYGHTKQPGLLQLAAHISENYPPLQAMRASGKVSLNHAYVVCAYLGGQVLYAQAADRPEQLSWVEAVWEDLVAHHLFPTFSMGVGERLTEQPPADEEDMKLQETCATVEWLLLNHRLYQATGNVRYAHMIENIVYNTLLGAQSNDGMKWNYYTPLTRTSGGKPWFDGPTMCCYWSGPRGIARLPQMVYHVDRQGLRVDLFEAGSVRWERYGREVIIEQQTNYPADGFVRLTVKTETPSVFALRLRIPLWAGDVRVTLNGQPLDSVAGQHTRIEREWADKDQLSIRFEMPVTTIEMADGRRAVRRGPEVLAVDAGDNPGLDLNQLVLPDPLGTIASVTAVGPRRRYEMNMLMDGNPQPVVLTPFAAVGNGDSGYRTTFPTRTEFLRSVREREE